MEKVKNDPKHYIKRSDLIARRGREGESGASVHGQKRDNYLAAPIDNRFYIDLRPVRSARKK